MEDNLLFGEGFGVGRVGGDGLGGVERVIGWGGHGVWVVRERGWERRGGAEGVFEDSWLEISWETLGLSNGLMRQVYLLDVWGRRNPGPSRLVKLVTLWSGKITEEFFREFDLCQRLTFSNDLLIANVLHERTEISGWFAPMMSMFEVGGPPIQWSYPK